MRTSLALLALVLMTPAQTDPAPIPGWLPDLPGGFAAAKKTGRPMMVVFR